MRIYVGGLSYSVGSDKLREMFAAEGNVTEANVVEDRYSGQSKGFGFVEMPDASEAKAAIAKFDGYSHDGRSLKVNEAKPRESGNGSRTSSGGRGW